MPAARAFHSLIYVETPSPAQNKDLLGASGRLFHKTRVLAMTLGFLRPTSSSPQLQLMQKSQLLLQPFRGSCPRLLISMSLKSLPRSRPQRSLSRHLSQGPSPLSHACHQRLIARPCPQRLARLWEQHYQGHPWFRVEPLPSLKQSRQQSLPEASQVDHIQSGSLPRLMLGRS